MRRFYTGARSTLADTRAVTDADRDPTDPPEPSDSSETPLTSSRPEPGRTGQLSVIAQMLSSAPAVRDELAEDIRMQINQDGYMSDEKLELAIYRMLKDILN